MPKVSILTPVFNTAGYLERHRSSVLAQTLPDWELVYFDDGSTDGSAAILQSFAASDPRVKFLRFGANRGVAAVRNALLDAATGEFVYFLDSDDWIDADFLETMVARAEQTGRDVVVNSHYVKEFDDPSKNVTSGRFGFLEGDGDYPAWQVVTFFPPNLACRLFRLRSLRAHQVRFPDMRNGEDNYFTSLAEMLQPHCYVFRGPCFHYYQRPGSLVHQKGVGYSYILSFKYLYEALVERGIDTEPLRLFYADQIILDSEEKFEVTRSFLTVIRDQVLRHPELYVARDLFLLDAVCACPDYSTFLARYSPNIDLCFLRHRMRSGAGLK